MRHHRYLFLLAILHLITSSAVKSLAAKLFSDGDESGSGSGDGNYTITEIAMTSHQQRSTEDPFTTRATTLIDSTTSIQASITPPERYEAIPSADSEKIFTYSMTINIDYDEQILDDVNTTFTAEVGDYYEKADIHGYSYILVTNFRSGSIITDYKVVYDYLAMEENKNITAEELNDATGITEDVESGNFTFEVNNLTLVVTNLTAKDEIYKIACNACDTGYYCWVNESSPTAYCILNSNEHSTTNGPTCEFECQMNGWLYEGRSCDKKYRIAHVFIIEKDSLIIGVVVTASGLVILFFVNLRIAINWAKKQDKQKTSPKISNYKDLSSPESKQVRNSLSTKLKSLRESIKPDDVGSSGVSDPMESAPSETRYATLHLLGAMSGKNGAKLSIPRVSLSSAGLTPMSWSGLQEGVDNDAFQEHQESDYHTFHRKYIDHQLQENKPIANNPKRQSVISVQDDPALGPEGLSLVYFPGTSRKLSYLDK